MEGFLQIRDPIQPPQIRYNSAHWKTGTGSVSGVNHSVLNWLSWTSCNANDRLESSAVGGGRRRTPDDVTTGLSSFQSAATGEETSWAYIVPKVGTTRQSS